jgi:tripartite-type tricarboxylate transporter receptor subunit TctC
MQLINRRKFVVGGAAVGGAALVPGHAAWAQAYPDHLIKLLIPLGAGSAVDVVVRVVAEKMAELLGQGIVVENQPGAAGLIGMNMHAAPGYDPIKDFVPITQLVLVNWALVAHPSAGIANVEELLTKARAQPDALTYASGGIGSPQHVAMELFMKATGVKLRHIPYKGAAQGLNDVVSGHVPLGFIGLPTPNEFIKNGQLKLVGQAADKRFAQFPDWPTIAEGG